MYLRARERERERERERVRDRERQRERDREIERERILITVYQFPFFKDSDQFLCCGIPKICIWLSSFKLDKIYPSPVIRS